jgi:hypothetical protein
MQRHPIMAATLLGALALAQPAGAADMLLL